MTTLKKLEMNRADYMKTEKTKKELEKFESQMMVASQAIETTSMEIIKLRETELYPQLLELVKGLVFLFFTCTIVLCTMLVQFKSRVNSRWINIVPLVIS